MWTATLVGEMHLHNVTRRELARETGFVQGYVSMILNGQRNPPDGQEMLESAFKRILARRGEADTPAPSAEQDSNI